MKKIIYIINRNEIKALIHQESKSSRRGIDETVERIKRHYYWPIIKSSVQTYINDCEICQQAKY